MAKKTSSIVERGATTESLTCRAHDAIGVEWQTLGRSHARQAALVHDLTKRMSVLLLFVGNLKLDLAESLCDLRSVEILENSICNIGSVVNQLADLVGVRHYPVDELQKILSEANEHAE